MMRKMAAVAAFAAAGLILSGCDKKAETTPPAAPSTAAVAAAAAAPASIKLDLAGVETAPQWAPATVEKTADGPQINSNPGSGGFSAQLVIPDNLRKAGPGKVRVTLKIAKGAMLVSAIATGDSSTVYAPGQPVAGPAAGAVPVQGSTELDIPDMTKPITILFANGSNTGPSVATVMSVELTPGAAV